MNGSSATATGALSTAVVSTTRPTSTVHAATMPNPSDMASDGSLRLRRENCSVTAVLETSPPSMPIAA